MKKQAIQKNKKTGGSGKGRSLSSRMLLFVLIFALLANAYMVKKLFFTSKAAYYKAESPSGEEDNAAWASLGIGKGSDEDSEEEKIIRAADVSRRWGLTDPVNSEEACRQAVRDLGPEIGLDVIRYDYPCVSLDQHHLMDTYTLQQCYRGIPVLGHVLTVAVEKDGRIRSIIGREAQLPDSLDSMIDSALSEKEAKALCLKELDRNVGRTVNEDAALKESKGLHILYNGEKDPCLVYRFTEDRKGQGASVLYQVDAVSGRIRSFGSVYDSAMTHVTLQGQKGEKKLAVDQIGPTRVLLRDTKRQIGIYALGRDGEAVAVNPAGKSDSVDPLKQSGVDALYNMQRAWQYFARVHGRKGLADGDGQIKVYLETGSGERDDQAFFVSNPDGGHYILIGDRKKYDMRTSAWLDLMGHEYSHGMINQAWKKEIGLAGPLENDVLAEGLADLFGELVEDSYDGKGKETYYDNSCDWISAGFSSDPRDAKKPNKGHISSYDDLASAKDPFDGTYLVTHPAWLLTQGVDGKEEGKWNNLRLSQLYYDALWSVNGLSDLADFRFALENSARALCASGRIDPAQEQALSAALDQVGIAKEAEDGRETQDRGAEEEAGGRDICLAYEGPGPAGKEAANACKKALLSYVGNLLEDQPGARIHILGLTSDGKWTQQNADYSRTSVNRAILDLGSGEEGRPADLGGLLSAASECLTSGAEGANKKEEEEGSQLIILWGEADRESSSDKAVSTAQSLKEKGTEIVCLDLADGVGKDQGGLDRIASEASFYAASDPDSPALLLSWILYRQAHPGKICRMTVRGFRTMKIYDKGKEVLAYGSDSPDTMALPWGLAWKEGEGSEKGETLVFECLAGTGLEAGLTGRDKSGDLILFYQDCHGNFSDKREFNQIGLGKKTVIYTRLDPGKASVLEIDENGDGLFDRSKEAGRNGKGKEAGHPVTGPVTFLALSMLALFLLVSFVPTLLRKILAKRKEKTGGPVCLHCGMKNRRGTRACRQCGKLLPAPVEGHESKFSRDREKAGFRPARIVIAGILLLLTLAHAVFCRQPGAEAYMDYAGGHPASGSYVCEQGLKEKDFQKKICTFLLGRFTGRLEKDDKVDPALAGNVKEAMNQLEK